MINKNIFLNKNVTIMQILFFAHFLLLASPEASLPILLVFYSQSSLLSPKILTINIS